MTKRLMILAFVGSAIALTLTPMAVNVQTRITYNPSPSAPVGFYLVAALEGPDELKRGDYVIIPTPQKFKMMAAQRHYLPLNVPLIKRIVGLPGDQICRWGELVYVKGKPVATALKVDSQGRFLPVWQGCLTLSDKQFFALMDAPDSFDGRYFGPLYVSDVVGIATPIYIP
ncbi:S26 family signal peptidase [Paremcibacter congregatus]|nr:S26 family signal peptidase [Paremcibacter congregatus]